jgi:uncharacterized membrane protein YtjA (UPF0391 family)
MAPQGAISKSGIRFCVRSRLKSLNRRKILALDRSRFGGSHVCAERVAHSRIGADIGTNGPFGQARRGDTVDRATRAGTTTGHDFVPCQQDFFEFPGLSACWNFHSRPGLFFQQARGERVPMIEFEENVMLSWVVTFLIIALIAGILGFGGIAGASIEIAKIVFFIAIALFVVSALVSLMRGRGSV